MSRRKVAAFSLIAVILVAFAMGITYLYLENDDLRHLAEQDRLRDMADRVQSARYMLEAFAGWYNRQMEELKMDVEENYIDELKDHLIWETARNLERFGDHAYYVIDRDLYEFLGQELSFEEYSKVSDALELALVHVIDWAGLGRDPSEAYNLLWELYYLLGIDQITRSENLSRLRGISYAFRELAIYWGALGSRPSDLALPETSVEWALGNATVLYQELSEWYESTDSAAIAARDHC